MMNQASGAVVGPGRGASAPARLVSDLYRFRHVTVSLFLLNLTQRGRGAVQFQFLRGDFIYSW